MKTNEENRKLLVFLILGAAVTGTIFFGLRAEEYYSWVRGLAGVSAFIYFILALIEGIKFLGKRKKKRYHRKYRY